MEPTSLLAHDGAYDEALERFHHTGPEFDGHLSNHGPMVVEALARLGRSERIHPWTDDYARRLDEAPRGIDAVRADDWRRALGDPTRAGDWIAFFAARSDDHAWADLLEVWWPRLLPGIAAGATHGVIRVGHAVRALSVADTGPRRLELAHALAYWATRWQAVPLARPTGTTGVAAALDSVPRVADQDLGIRHRLAQLPSTEGWPEALGRLAGPTGAEQVPSQLLELVSEVLARYATHAHGSPTMLVHAATAPMAVLNTLPALPERMWPASFGAAWTAVGAVLAAYAPAAARPAPAAWTAEDTLARALDHGGEHVVKLTDTALHVHAVTGRDHALAAARAAIEQDA